MIPVAPKAYKIIVSVVGKYTTQKDAYLSISHAITHAAAAIDCVAEMQMIDAEKIVDMKTCHEFLQYSSCILIPGG
jgi:CTP synthase